MLEEIKANFRCLVFENFTSKQVKAFKWLVCCHWINSLTGQ